MTRPTNDELYRAFAEAGEREPASQSWGFYSYSDAAPCFCGSGSGGFCWFDAKHEMLEFIQDYLVWYHPGPSTMSAEDIAKTIQAILSEADPTIADLDELCCKLNEFMKDLWQIQWVGTFQELCDSPDEFPTELRKGFHESCDESDLEQHAGDMVSAARPIKSNETQEFAQFVREWGI